MLATFLDKPSSGFLFFIIHSTNDSIKKFFLHRKFLLVTLQSPYSQLVKWMIQARSAHPSFKILANYQLCTSYASAYKLVSSPSPKYEANCKFF